MDPVIPPDILAAIAIIVISGLLAWLAVIRAGRAIRDKRARLLIEMQGVMTGTDQEWPDNCGDQGGMPEPVGQHRPKAPETGSGLLAERESRTIFKPWGD